MTRFIAFLRAINVGGHTVTMADLRLRFEALGLEQVETFIASGNVILKSRMKAKALRASIETHLQDALGYEVAAFLRTDAEVQAIVAYQPFSDEAMKSATALNVAFLHAEMDADAEAKLMELRSDLDDFHVHGREVYWLCRARQSNSKFSNALFERVLKLKTTIRGLNTVRKLASKYPPATVA